MHTFNIRIFKLRFLVAYTDVCTYFVVLSFNQKHFKDGAARFVIHFTNTESVLQSSCWIHEQIHGA